MKMFSRRIGCILRSNIEKNNYCLSRSFSKAGNKNRKSSKRIIPQKQSKELNPHNNDLQLGFCVVEKEPSEPGVLNDMSRDEFDNIIPADREEEKHATIERAWAILKLKELSEIQIGLIEKYKSIRRAMLELENTNKELFKVAIGESEEEQAFLYHRNMRPPTHMPKN